MSKYTTEVRFICESLAGKTESVGGNGIKSVIEKAVPQIFDFGFPIFKEEYRNVLATKILEHYYTREIGYETYGLWKFKLGVRLNEIMPYYNQLYESTLLEFNPLYDVDYTRTHERERNTEENGTSSRNSSTVNKNSSETNSTLDGTNVSESENENTFNRTTEGDVSTTTSNETNGTVNKSTESNSTVNKTNEGTSQTEKSGSSVTDAEHSGEGNTTANYTTNSSEWDLYSDTPQGTVANLNDEIYLTNARKKTKNESGQNSTNGTDSSTDKSTTTDSGNEKITSSGSGVDTTTAESSGTDTIASTDNGTENVENNETVNGTSQGTSKTSDTMSRVGKNTTNGEVDITESGENVSANTVKDIDSFLETVRGKMGGADYSEKLMKYRQTFLNIDLMVIEALSDLFMNLW